MPEWHLMTATLVGIATLSVAWSPLRLALPLCLATFLPSVAQACLGGARARFPDSLGTVARLARRALTAVLHLVQPIARLRGRIREGLTPWRRRCPRRPGPLWPVTAAVWSENWLEQDQRLRAMETDLRTDGVCALRGGRDARWDLEVRGGSFGAGRLLMGVEDHAGGKQLIRVRWWPVVPAAGPLLTVVFGVLTWGAVGDRAWIAAAVLGLGALLAAARAVEQCSAATATIREAVSRLLLAVTALAQLQGLASTLLRTYIGERLVLDFRSQLVQSVQRLSLSYHDSRGTADSIYRIQTDAPAIQNILVEGAIPFVSASATVVTMCLVTARLDRQLALVALTICLPLFLLSRVYRPRMRRQSRRVKKLESGALAVVQETLGALRVVKAFGQEAHETGRFVHRSREGVVARIRLALLEGGYGLLIGLVTALGMAAVLLIGVGHVRAGVITLGQLLLVLGYLGQLYEPLKTISRKATALQGYLASDERAFALLDEQPDVPERPHARPVTRATGAVEFRGVSFAYGPDQIGRAHV